MEGVEGSPPSKTTISESIWWVDNFNWWSGTIIFFRNFWSLRCFFLALRERRWKTLAHDTSFTAAAAHRVRRDEVEQDFVNTWTQGGEGDLQEESDFGHIASVFNKLSRVWQLNPDKTVVSWVKGLQWSLSLTIFKEDRCDVLSASLLQLVPGLPRDTVKGNCLLFNVRSFRRPCSEMWQTAISLRRPCSDRWRK